MIYELFENGKVVFKGTLNQCQEYLSGKFPGRELDVFTQNDGEVIESIDHHCDCIFCEQVFEAQDTEFNYVEVV